MRVVLFTGKGGVGKTTAAAGAAALAATRGLKALVLSTDGAHSLGDALGVPHLTGEPTEVAPGLFAQQVDSRERFEEGWSTVQGYLLEVLDAVGVDPVRAEELTVLPGAEEVLALLEVRDQVRSDRWDLVAVDCAPTAETLRLLALPEALGRYVERAFPVERRLVRTLRPVLDRVAGVPVPRDSVLDAAQRLQNDLRDVQEVLTAADSTVRLVLTPESVVVAEARRTLTSLSLFGYRVDGVIANRVFPSGGGDAWRAGWVAAQAEQLAERRDVVRPAAGAPDALPRRGAGRAGRAARRRRGDLRRRRPAGPPHRGGPDPSTATATAGCCRSRCRWPTAATWTCCAPVTTSC